MFWKYAANLQENAHAENFKIPVYFWFLLFITNHHKTRREAPNVEMCISSRDKLRKK